ncbi:MAG TPA: polysaccharide pyruvyl transferase family protein [Phenylobacterium sp.]|jgi:polysaccharide pyruvyl transferase WcaK-like protein
MTMAEDGAPAADISIGLLWHSTSAGNLGVGALTVGNLALIRQATAALGLTPHFHIMGFVDPKDPDYVTDPDVSVLGLRLQTMGPGGAYWRTLGQLDCVLDIGGGDSFTDIYASRRYTLIWLSKALAIARGVPLMLSPQTIGPFSRQPHSALATWAMSHCDVIMARDPMSFEVTRKMAPKARVVQTVDVAFALPFERRIKADPAITEVGVNVSGLLYREDPKTRDFGMHVDYVAYTRRLIAWLRQQPGVVVHLISHVNSDVRPEDDDRALAARLAAEFPGVVKAPNFVSPSAAKSYISGLDFLVAGRMHACIAAYSSGVPVVPVAYSRKFTGLFEGVLGYRHLVPVTGMDADQAFEFTVDRFSRRAELKGEIAQGNAKVADLLEAYGAELRRLFAQVVRRAA